MGVKTSTGRTVRKPAFDEPLAAEESVARNTPKPPPLSTKSDWHGFTGEQTHPSPKTPVGEGQSMLAIRSLIAGPKNAEQVHNDLEKLFPEGTIDAATELPQTLEFLHDGYQRMVAQFARYPDDYPGISPHFSSEIVIARDKDVNALAGVVADQDRNCVTKSVTVMTSGLISEFMNLRGVKLGVRERLLAILGVLAHELAHSVDKADPEGIELTRGKSTLDGSNMATEVRTDLEAQKLLQRAGLPMSALYYASKIVLHGQDKADRARSLVSTHPEITFRSAFQRSHLAILRMGLGDLATDIALSPAQSDAIVAETRALSDSTVCAPPKDLDDLNERLHWLPENAMGPAEFNACVLWFDAHLAAHPKADPADPVLNQIRRKIMSHPQTVSSSLTELETLLTDNEIDWFGSEPLRLHQEYLETLPFYCDPALAHDVVDMQLEGSEYGSFLYTEFKFRARATEGSTFIPYYDAHKLDRLAHDPSRGFSQEVIQSYVMAAHSVDSAAETEGRLAYLLERPAITPSQLELPKQEFIKYAAELHDQIIGPFVDHRNPLTDGETLFSFDYRYAVPTKQSRSYWREMLALYAAVGTAPEAKRILQSIWDNRGRWTALEFLSNQDFHIDWELIGESLSIPRDQLKSELQSSFKDWFRNKMNEGAEVEDACFVDLHPLPKKKPAWLASDMAGFIEGQIATLHPSAQSAARNSFFARYTNFFPKERTKRLQQGMHSRLRSAPPGKLQDIYNHWFDTLAAVQGIEGERSKDDPSDRIPIVWSALQAADVPDKLRVKFAKKLIKSTPLTYLNSMKQENIAGVYQALRDVGKVSCLTDFFEMVRLDQEKKWSGNPDAYAGYSERSVRHVIVELTQAVLRDTSVEQPARSTPDALEHLKRTAELLSFSFEVNEFDHTRELATLYLDDLATRSLSLEQKIGAFAQLTRFAGNSATDAYFRNEILPEIVASGDYESLRAPLTSGQITASSFQSELVQLVLQDSMKVDSAEEIIDKISELMPDRSNAKDELLEQIAWEQELTGQRLDNLIEREKTTNWRAIDPQPLVYNATVTEVLKMMSPKKRARLVEYLIHGSKKEAILDELLHEVKREVTTTYARAFSVGQKIGYTSEAALDRKLASARSAIVTMVNDSSEIQRVPVAEYLLTVGDDSIASDESMMAELLKRHMGVRPGTQENAILRAYLDVIPEHERELTLSYLLIHSTGSNAGEMNIRKLFEVFGAAGVKFGQLAAVWDVFGPEYREQLSDLFDNASPMTKKDIETLLKREMGDAYEGTVKRLVKVLGSASIKTVVLAELHNGENVALMIQRPEAKGQTDSNLKFARRFLERLEHYSVGASNPLFAPLVASVEKQMPAELDIAQEIANTNSCRQIIDAIHVALKPEMAGWSLGVPKISSDVKRTEHMFGMQAVRGVSAKEFLEDESIGAEERAHVGRIMTKSALRMLFKYGVFDPDRHPGNWIIDRETREIHFIDAGQLVHFDAKSSAFAADDPLGIARFLHAVESGSGTRVALASSALRKANRESEASNQEVAVAVDQAIESVSADAEPSEMLKAIVTALYGTGLELQDNFTFGGLKGLMTLAGSQNVGAEEFKELLASEVKSLYLEKAPAVVMAQASELVSASWLGLRNWTGR